MSDKAAEELEKTDGVRNTSQLSEQQHSSRRKQPVFDDLVEKYGCQLVQGVQLWEETLESTKIISTGCLSIDNVLDRGIYTGEVTEIFGPPSCGKTQFVFNLTATGLQTFGFNVLFYDSNCSLCIKRIKEILINRKKDVYSPMEIRELLSKLKYVKVFDVFKLVCELELLKEKLATEADEFALQLKLIIIDSVHSVITPILGGKQFQGHALMMRLSILLKELAYDYGIAVVVLNGTVANNDKYDQTGYSNSKFKPALGKYWVSVPHNRLFIDFASTKDVTLRSLVIHRHSRLPARKSKALFHITTAGLSNNSVVSVK